MFKPEDFHLPLESDLRMRVIADEIENCKDEKVLQEHLKQTTRLVMLYQHMLDQIVKRQLTQDLEQFEEEFLAMLPKQNG